jgi:uncharacterized membrane protein YdjX (TVP38/TMEM64 family)
MSRCALALAITAAAILVPFVLFGAWLEAWTEQTLTSSGPRAITGALVVALLAGDIVLPVPSSLISTASGALLGFGIGLAASGVGMTLGAQIGYALGRFGGLPLTKRLISEEALERVSARVRRRGLWMLALTRPVPVLAEASAFWAGIVGIGWWRYSLITLCANLVISAIYAAAGAALFSPGLLILIIKF